MSAEGLQVAKDFGQRLLAFGSQAEAEAYLFGQRDHRLRRLCELASASDDFIADFTPASLKNLESWYFALCDSDGFGQLDISREELECCMASYFCEVAVRNCSDAKWIVQEFAFERGKYEIGIKRGLLHWMRSRFADLYNQPNNKRRPKIYKSYEQLFAA